MLKDSQKDKEIILKYLPLVKSLAYRIHRHLPDVVDINDLIGYGILAVLESAPKLDNTKNPKAYLRLRIKGAMYDYLRPFTPTFKKYPPHTFFIWMRKAL